MWVGWVTGNKLFLQSGLIDNSIIVEHVEHYSLNLCYNNIIIVAGNPGLFNYAQTSVFTVKHLGHLKNVALQYRRRSSGESQTDTLEAIDTAQVNINQSPWKYLLLL